MTLYRPEAVDGQRRRLYGSVTIHQPASLTLLTGTVAVLALVAGTFMATASFPQKEAVTGWIVPDTGMAQIYATKGGVANQVKVKVGDAVAEGQTLAVLSVDISGPEGALAPQQRALTQSRLFELDRQIAANTVREGRETARLKEHAAALRTEADHLETEYVLEQQQLTIARRQLADILPLVSKGFVAAVERDRRQQLVFSTEQSLADIRRQVDAKRAEALDADAQIRSLPMSNEIEVSQLRAQRATVAQSLAELAVQDTLSLRAPVAGRIAAVNIRAGDSAPPGTPLFVIAPTSGRLEAELLAPTRAAGFIATGQRVQLAIDAFPSERFGQVEGVVNTVSRAPITLAQVGIPLDIKEPVYRLTVHLSADHVMAYGKQQPFQPGMTLKASVVTSRRTLFQWMFDPLLAAGRTFS